MLQLISGCDTWSFKEVSLDTYLTIHSVGCIWSLYASAAKNLIFAQDFSMYITNQLCK